ncbi:MAG: thioredoxin domain-containing protein [Nitrospirae bacterium]|nr:thioredoxin domain-containing protein [Nitrospirota bacterium]
MDNKKVFILSIVLMLMLFVTGGLLFKSQEAGKIESAASKNSNIFIREHSQTLGLNSAKVVITEFLDPGCETCSAFAPFIKSALDTFPGKIKLVVKYAPLHHGADYMVKILEAARKQGKYWETLQVMYDKQPVWASHSNPQPDQIWQFLPQTGLDIKKLKNDMNDPEIERLIQQDIADAQTLNVTKTPGFFVNGKPLVSFGAEQLKELILSELKSNYPNDFN